MRRESQPYLSGSMGDLLMDLVNASALIARSRDAHGSSARPITIPTGFRKLAALICLQRWRPATQLSCGRRHQFGAGTKDGSLRFATALRGDLDTAPEVIWTLPPLNAFICALTSVTLWDCSTAPRFSLMRPILTLLSQALSCWLARCMPVAY